MATPTEHEEISERFLRHAEREFERGDMLQASEKAWGAVVHYVKAIGKSEGLRTHRHRHINIVAEELIDRLDNPSPAKRNLGFVNALHANFYEDWLPEGSVREGLDSARELIEDLKVAKRLSSRHGADNGSFND